jgi:NitT/TauT family transport system permease protein
VSRARVLVSPPAAATERSAMVWLAAAGLIALLSVFALSHVHAHADSLGAAFWILILALWLAAWKVVGEIARLKPSGRAGRRLLDLLIPLCFGAFLLFLWEVLTVGLRIPMVLLPSPSAIWARMVGSIDILRADFVQTFIRAVLPGWGLGCASGFLIAILADRVPYLARGLIPIGNFVSALPVIGIAPIMVMWFGFDWQSKVAVVVVMTFFPMLVNTIAGLSQSSHLERDLMRSYGATYGQTLLKLRLWAALPFIFNALKINSTLALIGAIVAEFFGTPIVGMGFRISTEVGRMSLDMVWAEIAVAALAGSAFYGLLALIERAATFWHPSYRGTLND